MIDKPFTGDFDEMVKRRVIRVAVTFNRTHYFIDSGQERGMTYESLKLFENDLNTSLKTAISRSMSSSCRCRGMSCTPPDERQGGYGRRDGDRHARTGEACRLLRADAHRREPGRGHRAGRSANQLRWTTWPARRCSSARGAFTTKASSRLNAQLKERGKPPVVIAPAPDVFEDDDVLEMVNAGLVPITVVDDYLAEFWKQVFTDITVHKDVTLRSGGNLAVAFRTENPKLREFVNTWIRKHGQGDAFRNVIEQRYLQSVKYAKNAAADAERRKLPAIVELFKKYGAQYKMDYLLMAAQGYQESTLDQSAKSPVGAIGVMQVMPATGKELKVGDITKLEPNIHAGVKYMRFMMDQYFKDEPMDDLNKGLMTFAAYNAGPGRLRQLRREAEKRGLNPNVWFGNVERIASERIGRETVTYVSNIYKYYVAYSLIAEQAQLRAAAKTELEKSK